MSGFKKVSSLILFACCLCLASMTSSPADAGLFFGPRPFVGSNRAFRQGFNSGVRNQAFRQGFAFGGGGVAASPFFVGPSRFVSPSPFVGQRFIGRQFISGQFVNPGFAPQPIVVPQSFGFFAF